MDRVSCYFDITIDGHDYNRVVFELFNDECPRTCENFRCLCTGECGLGKQSRKPLHYKDTPFHRVVRNFMIQGGDITERNGKGGDSIYNGSFADENLNLKHDKPYLLSMANRGPDTNRSQFFITTTKAPHLDGKHVVFGRVVSGVETIHEIESLEVDPRSRPLKEVLIRDCGQLSREELAKPITSQDELNRTKKRRSHSFSPQDLKSTKRRRSRSLSSQKSSSSSSKPRSSDLSQCYSRRSRKRTRSRRISSCSSLGSSSNSSSRSSGSSSSDSTSSGRSCSTSTTSGSGSSRSGSCDDSSSLGSSSTSTRSNSRSSDSSQSSGSFSSDDSTVDESCDSSKTPPKRLEEKNTAQGVENNIQINQEEDHDDNDSHDSFVNPHYKCSVKPDEIPEIPVNRFLLRNPLMKSAKNKDKLAQLAEDGQSPVAASQRADLSKFEDINEDDNLDASTTGLKSRVKPTESVLSRSGRIMRGRGNFKFRTPSPDDSKKGNRQYRFKSERRHYERSRYRSRSRSRSPDYRRYRKLDKDNDGDHNDYRHRRRKSRERSDNHDHR